ncbi:MAG TPA: SatD family protein [Intrasporangium sp.]|uniref:SatD family protein n=1 Tax=Intrasporangium sp. TaxID=1925024 RepID=UPI002B466B27|nr:SatD family protein [Intrasporangium sp.]HKX66611.1 SatD family protein [Intrasporangium sp.]
MLQVKEQSARVALIGDIVESRRTGDRQALHDIVAAVLARTNAEHAVVDPAVITLGDEFQGVYATLGDALTAAFRIRAGLRPHDVRFGLGRGDIQTLDSERGIHDGPAYWAARDAIVEAARLAGKAALRTTRTVYLSPEDAPALVVAVNAALTALDHILGSLSPVSWRILGGRLEGLTQQDIAAREGITPSAVSQRVRSDGIGVAMETMRMLGELP